jgi:hypothetical protein
MSFKKRILPKIDELKELYYKDKESFISIMKNADVLMGSEESIEWVEKKLNEWKYKKDESK